MTYSESLVSTYSEDYAVNWYKINEGFGTTLNDSKGGRLGTVFGATWSGTDSLSFNGTSNYASFNASFPMEALSFIFEIETTQASFARLLNSASLTNQKGIACYIGGDGLIGVGLGVGTGGSFKNSILSTLPVNDGSRHVVKFTWDGKVGVNNIKLYIDDMQVPHRTASATHANVVPTYNTITFGKSIQTNDQFFQGKLYSVSIFNQDVSKIELYRSLIFDSGQYKKYTTVWETISTSKPSVDIFINEGMKTISPTLDRVNGISPLDSLSPNYSIVTWSTASKVNLTLEADISPQLVYPTSDISLVGIETIDKITLLSTGNSKIAISFDSGITWVAFKNGIWETISNAHMGMTNLELNALTSEQIELARNGSMHIRFNYSLSDDAEVDNIEMRVSLLGYEKLANTSDFAIDHDANRNFITFKINKSGSYSVNYVDA